MKWGRREPLVQCQVSQVSMRMARARGLPPKTNQVPAVSLGPTCLPHLIWKTVGVPTLSPCFCPWPSPTTALISAQLEDSFAHVSHKVSWVTHLSLKPSRVPVPPLLA